MIPRPAIAAVVALVVLGASACSLSQRSGPEVSTGAPDDRRSIAVVGDSLTVQSEWAIHEHGDRAGFATRVDATSGFRTSDKQGAAEAVAATRPDAAVIALGTNDAVCALANSLLPGLCKTDPSFGLTDMERDLDTMAATLRQPGTCVVGVSVYFGLEVGQHFDQMVAEGTLDGVVDWRTVVNADERLRADGIGHLTRDGQDAFAQLIVDETARICSLDSTGPPAS